MVAAPDPVKRALGLFFAFAFGVIGLTLLVRAAAAGRGRA